MTIFQKWYEWLFSATPDQPRKFRPIMPIHPGSVLTDYRYQFKTPTRITMTHWKYAKEALKLGASLNYVAAKMDVHVNTVRLIKKSRSLKHYRQLRRHSSKPESYPTLCPTCGDVAWYKPIGICTTCENNEAQL